MKTLFIKLEHYFYQEHQPPVKKYTVANAFLVLALPKACRIQKQQLVHKPIHHVKASSCLLYENVGTMFFVVFLHLMDH